MDLLVWCDVCQF